MLSREPPVASTSVGRRDVRHYNGVLLPPRRFCKDEILTKSDKTQEPSLATAPIYPEAMPRIAAPAEQAGGPISEHIERHLGPVDAVFHEITSEGVRIEIHVVAPTEKFPFVRLVTSGMSDLPMATPDGEVHRHAELMITLPADWKLDEESFKDESWYWPVSLLRYLAHFPRKYQTWLGWGHTIPNGDPAQPYAKSTELCGAILLSSPTVPEEFHTLKVGADKEIVFYSIIPLYREEMDLKLRSGTDKLLERLFKKGVSDVIGPMRKNVGKKVFGLF
jgi:hypothetical protein